MNNLNLIEEKTMRDTCIERLDILDKVKELFLVPEMDIMTTRQVAEYYEVDVEAVQRCYQRHKSEITADGVVVKTVEDFRGEQVVHAKKSSNRGGGIEFYFSNSNSVIIPYGKGTKCFSKRAILRIGMLLRDSGIAKEVRTQLLNTFEHTVAEQKTKEILAEEQLLLDLARSYVSKDFDALVLANQNYIDYQNRRMTALKSDNKALAGSILEWAERSKINYAVRYFSNLTHISYGAAWNKLYNELYYKHHIGLRLRGSAPYIKHVREDEWPLLMQSFFAICEENDISPSEIMEKAKISKNNIF